MKGQRCPGCGHESHAGRCHVYDEPTPSMVIECPCEGKEAPDGSDSPASGGSRGLPVAGLPVDRAAAQQRLATLGGELAAGAEDVLARIGEIGQTLTDAAARWRGPRA